MDSTVGRLSAREVDLLASWERTGVSRITTAELASTLDVSKPMATMILARLYHKGALEHLGRGVYGVRPMRAIGAPWSTSSLISVANLLSGRDYYVGGPVALTTHHLTEQVYHSVVDVFVADRLPPRQLGPARIVFHTLAWPEAYRLGIAPVSIGQVTVQMSDPERTLLDLIDRPNLLGSARSAISTVRRALNAVDVDRLIAYAARWPRRSTRQRLGYVLDRAGVSRARLAPLLQSKRPTQVVPLFVDEPNGGPIHSPWRVRDNSADGTTQATGDDS
ncbi:MAG: type IV toxin-antitoxin system AbiEi family antitoxin domain-containing protein [Chloroflexota bacterium]